MYINILEREKEMPKFQIASDLHIEYKNDDVPDPLTLITPSADILILAGDIGSFYKYKQLESFLLGLCPYFKVVLYVPGNHEYYKNGSFKVSQSMSSLLKSVSKLEKKIHNLYILDRKCVQIEDVCIVGCTLWSDVNVPVPKFIVRIEGMNSKIYRQQYKRDLEYINKMIKYCNKKSIKLLIVTHHCPTYSVITNKKKKDRYISLYASHLDHLLTKEQVHTWVCGHIHINFDKITEGGTRVIGNQRGKPKDNIKDYNKNFVISV